MKVALLGPKGTYTHQAAEEYFEKYEPVFCSTIREAIDAKSDATVLPFENSVGGGVGESIDLFRRVEGIKIVGEKVIPIRHFLLSKEESLDDIEVVKSHSQALDQCREFLSNYDWEEREASSTAKAAQEIGGKEAAIASEFSGKLNDLNFLRKNIQDRKSNETKFFILGNNEQESENKSKTSLILESGRDRPGLLQSMLSCFSGHGINLSYIQSRPTKESLGKYFFFVEAEASLESDRLQRTLQCLKTYSDVKVLGSYESDKGGDR